MSRQTRFHGGGFLETNLLQGDLSMDQQAFPWIRIRYITGNPDGVTVQSRVEAGSNTSTLNLES
jgi:hypothetical protein